MKTLSITILLTLWAVLIIGVLSKDDHHKDHWGHCRCQEDDGGDHFSAAQAIPMSGQTFQGKPSSPSVGPHEEEGDDEDEGPDIPIGRPRGPIIPSSPPINLTIMGEGSNIPRYVDSHTKRQECGGSSVLFDNNTIVGNTASQPPEPSGARAGNVIFSTYNFNISVSLDGGATFHVLDPTVYSGPANPATDAGYCCDQIVQYLPSIDRFVWLIQYWSNASNSNKLRIISFHPRDVDSSGINSWIFLDILSTDIKLTNQFDAGELAVGDNYLWLASTNTGTGLVVIRIPIAALNVVGPLTYWYTNPSNGAVAYLSRLSQNPGDTLFWAGHSALGTTMRVFKWPESGTTYFWNDIGVNGWSTDMTKFTSTCPGAGSSTNWVFSGAYATVLGSTRRSANEVWFAWAAPSGGGFPNVHIQVVQIDTSNFANLRLVRQWQVWNSAFGFIYPAFYTNQCGDVGLTVMFGGGSFNPTSALGIVNSDGILTQTVYYPELSDVCENRNGDYLTVRSADGFRFEAFVYAERSTAGGGIQRDVRFIEFRRG